jgi:cytochrome c
MIAIDLAEAHSHACSSRQGLVRNGPGKMTMWRARLICLVLIFTLFPVALAFFLWLVAAGPVSAQELRGDASSGRRLAEAWCSECHSIELKTARTEKVAPAFTAIAKRESTTALALNAFLRSNHNTMPNFIVEQGDADAIVAYILSLRSE